MTVSGHNVTVTKAALPTSVSGNAGTATKLATSRVIAIAGAVQGSATFDGSSNVSINSTLNGLMHLRLLLELLMLIDFLRFLFLKFLRLQWRDYM